MHFAENGTKRAHKNIPGRPFLLSKAILFPTVEDKSNGQAKKIKSLSRFLTCIAPSQFMLLCPIGTRAGFALRSAV